MVKNLLFVCLLTYFFFFNSLFAQVPQGINYQGVARDASGQALKGVSVNLLFELYDNSSGGNLLFNETVNKTTDVQTGIFTHVIGSVNSSGFTSITWATGSKYLQVSVNGTVTGRQQLMSVPYALYAASAGNTYTPSLTLNGNNLAINGGNTVTLPSGTTYTPALTLNGNNLAINGGNTVTLPTSTTYTPALTLNGANLSINGGNTVTLPTGTTYTAGGGINITGNTISTVAQTLSLNQNSLSISGGNTVVFPVPTTISVPSNSLLSSTNTGNNYTLNVTPQVFTQAGNTFSSNYGGSITVPSATTLIAPTTITINSPHTATSTSSLSGTTINLNIDALAGSGTTNFIPIWTNTNTLGNSNTSQSANGALVVGVNNVAGSAPLIVRNFNGGNGLTIHQGTNTATGLAFNTNITNPHSIGTIDAQTLGFFTGNTNTTGNFPLSLKSNNEVEIGQSLNFRSLAVAPLNASANEGRIYFNGTKFRVSENGGGFVDLVGTNIWNTTGNAIHPLTNTNGLAIGTNTLNFNFTSYSLAVNGAQYINSFFNMAAGSFTPGAALASSGRIYFDGSLQKFMVSENNTTYVPLLSGNIWSKSGIAVTLLNPTDNLGIGISPSAKFEVLGSSKLTNTTTADALIISQSGTSGSAALLSSTNGSALNATSSSTVSSAILSVSNNTVNTVYAGFFDGGLRIKSKAGGISADALRIDNNTINSIFKVTENGFVGINQAGSPITRLDIRGASAFTNPTSFTASPETAINIYNSDLTANNFSSLIFSTQLSNSATIEMAKIVAQNTNHTPLSVSGDLVFLTREPSDIFERMRILGNGNVGINVTSPAYQLAVVNNDGVNAAVFGGQQNTVISNSAHGIHGTTNNSGILAAGVYGINAGSGPSIYAQKNSGAGAALRAETQTANAAIHAITGTSSLSALALLIENGHIKASSNLTPSVSITTNSLGFTATPSITAQSNDVRGVVTINTLATGIANSNFIDVTVQFNKNYGSSPVVSITPAEPNGFTYAIINPLVGQFTVRIINRTGGNLTLSSPYNYLRFNYFVIE